MTNQAHETKGALRDPRLRRRLMKVTHTMAAAPAMSFPKAMRTEADLEATYRFLNNEAVTPEGILAPHVAATRARARDAATVIVAHDTTECSFSSEREGLGRINDGGHGVFAHLALAVAPATPEQHIADPLGIVGM